MAIRPNNLGQEKKQTWGVVGKRKDYKNEAFAAIEEAEKKKKYDWEAKLRPWSGLDKGTLWVNMPSKTTTPPPTTTTTTTVALKLWETTTTNWEATSDTWDTI